MTDTTTIRLLPASGKASHLFILLHGVGADARGLQPLASMLHARFPDAAIEIPTGFFPFDAGAGGRQWFSVRGVTEQNRPQRVAEALPVLVQWVRDAQQRNDISAAATTLVGFSQGAIMALEASAAHDGLAGRVVAFAGRYAALPATAPRHTRIHLLHGDQDAVMPVALARAAFEHLQRSGGDASLDIAAGVGHELPPTLVDKALARLTGA